MKVPLPFKVILLGNYGVGKTLFLERASKLSDLEGRSSILTDLINESAGSFRIRVRLDNDNNGQLKLNHNQEAKVEGLIRTQSPKDATSIETVLLDLFDPSGMEQYDSIPRSFYRHADAVLLFFDVTDRQSWLDVGKWHQKALENSRKVPLTFMLVGTKSDETRKRQVTLYEARRLADSFNVSLMETSAKFGTNIPACMSNLSASLVAKHRSYIKVPRSIKVDETKQHMPMYLTNVNEESASSCWGSAFALDSATYGNDFSTTSNQLILDLLLAKAGEKAVLAHQLHHRDSSGAGKLCPWGCGSIIKNFSSNSAKHFESECTNRFITCKLGCGLRTRKQEISDHMQRLCSNRVELCLVKGCDEIVKASLLSFHQGEYKKKPISLWKRYDIIHWVNDIVRCEARLRNGIDGRLLMNQLVIEGQNNIAALKRILNVHLGDFESENDVYARLLKSLQRIRETEEHYANKRDVAIIKRSDEYMEVNNVNTIVQERDHEDSAQQEKQSNINKLDSTENKRTDGQFRRKSENNSLMESIRGFQVHELSRISGNEISSSGMPSQQAPFSLSLTAGIATFDRSALRRASSSSATGTFIYPCCQHLRIHISIIHS
mmetsp:Transcript_27171/g.33055  ORF Transcript_27171/g.33055 Transcript_27171/m.33055 type:complete len:606 (-) Transcript_27171:93-1910(-)